jgi:hypothetical protein
LAKRSKSRSPKDKKSLAQTRSREITIEEVGGDLVNKFEFASDVVKNGIDYSEKSKQFQSDGKNKALAIEENSNADIEEYSDGSNIFTRMQVLLPVR